MVGGVLSWTAVVDVGAIFPQSFFYIEGDRAVDLTGWDAVFRFRDSSGAIILQLSSAASSSFGSVTVDATIGKILLAVGASGTAKLTGTRGTYELEITQGGSPLRLLDGPARYRQRGSGSLDSTYVVVRRDPQSVTIERATINEIRIVDRGPPGRSGTNGSDGSPGAQGDPLVMATASEVLPQRPYHQPDGYVFDDGVNKTRQDLDFDDPRKYGATQVDTTTVATGTAGSAVVSLGSANGWKNGNYIQFDRLGAAHGLSAPAAPTVIPQGITGATTWSVIIVWRTINNGQSAAGTPTVITTANATLSAANFLDIWPESVPTGAYRGDVYCQRGGSGGTHSWYGSAIAWPMVDGHTNLFPARLRITSNTAPTAPAGIQTTVTAASAATTNCLFGKILSGGGTTSVTLNVNVQTSGSGVTARTCNRMAFEDAFRAHSPTTLFEGTEVRCPRGIWPMASDLRIQSPETFIGGRVGLQTVASWLKFIDGFGLYVDNSLFGQCRQPGEQIRLGDRRQATKHWLNRTVIFEATNVGSGTFGFTGSGNDPAWNFTLGATTTDGDVTWTARGLGELTTAYQTRVEGVGIQYTGMKSPIGRYVLPALLENNYTEKADAFSNGWRWIASTGVTGNNWCLPPAGSETGKMYQFTAGTPGTTGSGPSWSRTNGATFSDNGMTLTTVDLEQIQGGAINVTAPCTLNMTVGRSIQTGCHGSCAIFDGGSTTSSGATSRSSGRFFFYSCTGNGLVIFGPDAQVGEFEVHTYNINQGNGQDAVQDDSFYGNLIKNSTVNVTGYYENRGAGVASVQTQGMMFFCYSEGAGAKWNFPAGRIGGNVVNSGSALTWIGGSSPSQPWSYLGENRDQLGTVSTTMTAGIRYFRAYNGSTVAAEERETYDSTRGRITTSHGSSPIVEERVFNDARGHHMQFPQGIGVSPTGDFSRLSGIIANQTSGVVSRGDLFIDNTNSASSRYSLFQIPDKYGYLGSAPSARANSTAYSVGTTVTQSSRVFVCTVAGTSASSAPSSMTTAVFGQKITDDTPGGGTLEWMCWTNAAATMRCFPNIADAWITLANADATILVNNGVKRDCATATANRAITLGTTNAKAGHQIRLRNLNNTAFKWEFTNGGGGGGIIITFPAGSTNWAHAEFDGTNWSQIAGGAML